MEWRCHAAIHRPDRLNQPQRVVLELELIDDQFASSSSFIAFPSCTDHHSSQNPISTAESEPYTAEEQVGLAGDGDFDGGINPTHEDLMESTVSIVRPLRTLARIREKQRRKGRKQSSRVGEMDVVGLLGQINDQMSRAEDLETFLKVRLPSPIFPLPSSLFPVPSSRFPLPSYIFSFRSPDTLLSRLLPAFSARCALFLPFSHLAF
jgi:hypothetical protein